MSKVKASEQLTSLLRKEGVMEHQGGEFTYQFGNDAEFIWQTLPEHNVWEWMNGVYRPAPDTYDKDDKTVGVLTITLITNPPSTLQLKGGDKYISSVQTEDGVLALILN